MEAASFVAAAITRVHYLTGNYRSLGCSRRINAPQEILPFNISALAFWMGSLVFDDVKNILRLCWSLVLLRKDSNCRLYTQLATLLLFMNLVAKNLGYFSFVTWLL